MYTLLLATYFAITKRVHTNRVCEGKLGRCRYKIILEIIICVFLQMLLNNQSCHIHRSIYLHVLKYF